MGIYCCLVCGAHETRILLLQQRRESPMQMRDDTIHDTYSSVSRSDVVTELGFERLVERKPEDACLNADEQKHHDDSPCGSHSIATSHSPRSLLFPPC